MAMNLDLIPDLLKVCEWAAKEPCEAFRDSCAIAECDEWDVTGVVQGNHGMFAFKADADFYVAARHPDHGYEAVLRELLQLTTPVKVSDDFSRSGYAYHMCTKPRCQTHLETDWRFCPKCGSRVEWV